MIFKAEKIELKGHEVVLRPAEAKDANILIKYLKDTAAETPFLAKEPEEYAYTEDGEIEYINNINNSSKDVMILCFVDGEYAGNSSILSHPFLRESHRGTVGIALYLKYTSMGLGTLLFEKMFELAKEMGYEQLDLEVNANNTRAQGLYKKMDFVECGRMPNAVKYKDGTYADKLTMNKFM